MNIYKVEERAYRLGYEAGNIPPNNNTPDENYKRGFADAAALYKIEGKWEICPHGYLKCTICDQSVPADLRSNFCPSCGARMVNSDGGMARSF